MTRLLRSRPEHQLASDGLFPLAGGESGAPRPSPSRPEDVDAAHRTHTTAPSEPTR